MDRQRELDDRYIRTVQEEYARIDETWLRLHYKILTVLVAFAFFAEVVMGLLLVNSDLISTTVGRFVLKYIVAPGGVNFALLAAATLVIHARGLAEIAKIYCVSLLFVSINFVLFMVHGAFASIYYIAGIAVLLTVIYADYTVTGATALASAASMAAAELLIRFDPDKASVFENAHRLGEVLVSFLVLLAFSLTSLVVVRFERKKNLVSLQKEVQRQQLQHSLQMDDMTGIYNRKAFYDHLKFAEDAALWEGVILAIVDLDRFKDINDTWGHHAGDRCLVEFADILREYDESITPFRYGGDEFCLLFWGIEVAQAEAICREIKAKVERLAIAAYPGLGLTASFGLAELWSQMDTVRLFTRADCALYEAKKIRNNICIFREKGDGPDPDRRSI